MGKTQGGQVLVFVREAGQGRNEWLETFRKDMRSVLLAELDVRLQPVEGLLATLRAS